MTSRCCSTCFHAHAQPAVDCTLDAAEHAAAIAVSSPNPLHKASIDGLTSPAAMRRNRSGGDRRSASSSSPSVCCCGLSLVVVVRLLVSLSLLALLTASVIWFDTMKIAFMDTLNYVQQLGPLRGSIVLCIANIVGAMLLMPCVPFTLGAGFLYGTLVGSAIVSVASTVAAVFAFLAARYLARTSIERSLGAHAKFRILDSAIHQDGFRIVLLIRSSPLHPYGIMNWLFGLTSITLRDYTVASFLGMLPGTVMEVWFGTAMKNVADILSGGAHNSVASRVFFWCGLVFSVVATGLLTVLLKRKLRAELDKYQCVATSETEAMDDDEFGLDDAENGAAGDSDCAPPLPLSLRVPAIEMEELQHTHTSMRLEHESALGHSPPVIGALHSAHGIDASLHRGGGPASRRNSDVRRLVVSEPTRLATNAHGVSGTVSTTRAVRTKSNSSVSPLHATVASPLPLSLPSATRSPISHLPVGIVSPAGDAPLQRSSSPRADAQVHLIAPQSPSQLSPAPSTQDDDSVESDQLIDTNHGEIPRLHERI